MRSLLYVVVFLLLVNNLTAFISRLSTQKSFKFTSTSLYSTTIENNKPKWAGSGDKDILSKLVNILINFKPLYNLMKPLARQTLINTAEKNGIPWSNRAKELLSAQNVLEEYYNKVNDPTIIYPDYYNNEFHAYDEGN